jgi:hypothetical protein
MLKFTRLSNDPGGVLSGDAETDYTTFVTLEWQWQWTKQPDLFSGLIRCTMGVLCQNKLDVYAGLFIWGTKWSKCSLCIARTSLGRLERSWLENKGLTHMGQSHCAITMKYIVASPKMLDRLIHCIPPARGTLVSLIVASNPVWFHPQRHNKPKKNNGLHPKHLLAEPFLAQHK